MDLLIGLAAFVAVIGLVAAAFASFFDSRQATDILKTIGMAILALLVAPVVVAQFVGGSESPQVLIGLTVISVVAYVIRESRRPRREPPYRTGHAERTPVLPSRTEDQ